MLTNTFTHPKDCPDRKEAAADRKAHETAARARELRFQSLAHAEWFDSGPGHAPSYVPANQLPPQAVADWPLRS